MTAFRTKLAIQTIRQKTNHLRTEFRLRHKVLHTIGLYGMAIAVVALTGVIRAISAPLLGDHHRYVFFFAAIAITSWCAGFWPSVVAILLSYLIADWILTSPSHAFDFHVSTADDFLGLAGFLISGLAIAFTSEALYRAEKRAGMKQQLLEKEVTERKRIQQQLEQVQAELQEHAVMLEKRVVERTASLTETIQSLEGVCYHIAHDLRSPVRVMQGYATLLLDENAPNLNQAGVDYARGIAESAIRMDNLIRDLLDYGRLGHLQISSASVEVEARLESVLAQLRPEVKSTRAEIQVERPLPPVSGDSTLLDQILSNLLVNALKFVGPGVAPRIRVRAETGPGTARLWIEDNGIGIPPEYHQKVFEIFERLHANHVYPGTGIGLAIVAKAVQRMGGRAGVQSEPGRGSRFWVEFQLATTNDSPHPASPLRPA
ncbi:MAG: two-component hybrid sensor and regulator [Pedosphaera sp.]|nr:two-component hybrid sensor and regulator [Pedosphaera sp.]